jgi:vancomycin resistance protein YoaR
LQALLNEWATQIALPARDARLHFNPDTGAVTVVQASQVGRKLDIEATQAAVQAALSKGGAVAKLALVAVPPAVDMNKIAEMGIRELVASATTYFKGSSAARIHNIAVGADKVDGVTIPPGGVFSFNSVVENVTSANDFEDSLVIVGDTTAVGAGGGICQVSTTVFRAAYDGGFPIVERYNHGYVVSWYGEPGLDATIFTPSVDFRFRNDTNAYLLVESAVDAANGTITINLWGAKPDRQVTINKPVQSEVKQPEPPAYNVDPSLAKDEKQQVEWEHAGMTVTVERIIVENGTTRTDTLVSKYQPWRAVYLVGPGTEIPATPTPAVSTVVTGTNTVSSTEQTGTTP